MDLSYYCRLSSLLLIIICVLIVAGSSFFTKDMQPSGVPRIREILKNRNVDTKTNLHELRGKRWPEPRTLNALEPTSDQVSISKRKSRKKTRKNKKNKKKNSENRVSFKECNLELSLRLDCGYYGITEEACAQRECCYGETTEPDIPWCYHSIPTINSQCLLDKSERLECGYYGIRKEQCLAQDCCWQPTNDGSVPWCYNAIKLPIFTGECGLPAIAPSVLSRIVGGVDAVPHSWPWMVSLQADQWHYCGGTLINEQWIVTAAHCEGGLYYGDENEVVLGMHSRASAEPTQIRAEVAQILPHENYGTQSGMDNDIMLLKLREPIVFTDEVSPVCLPEADFEAPPGRRCYTTGWGRLESGGSSPDILQQVMVPIIENDVCNKEEWYGGAVDDTMICAGFEEGGRDSCQGDSGGPLICYEDGHWDLVGIVSWGYGCASERKPGVYAKVSIHIDWIQEKINDFPLN